MLVVLNSFTKRLFITKSSDVVDRSKGSCPYNDIGNFDNNNNNS